MPDIYFVEVAGGSQSGVVPQLQGGVVEKRHYRMGICEMSIQGVEKLHPVMTFHPLDE